MLYYLLPEISLDINESNLKISFINKFNSEENDIFISQSFCKYLKKLKELINENVSNWDNIKKYTNPYEFIHSNIPLLNYSISKYRPISRAFFKLIEIYNHFDLLPNKDSIKTFHLAEGPGGFIEATNFLRKNKSDRYYGITLINNDNNTVPNWKKATSFLKKNSHVIIEKGPSGDGNLINEKNFEYICKTYHNSMDIVTGDAGFDFSGDFNRQENNIFPLLYTQIMYALILQKYNGNFVLKIFDIFLKNTCQIIYLLSCFYKKVYITKPNTSRYANSEKYIVCKYFKYTSLKHLYKRFHNIISVIHNIDFEQYELTSIFNINIQSYYLIKLEEINGIFIHQQVENILNTTKLISYGDKKRDKIELLKNQNILKCVQWCEQFNIKYNKDFSPSNVFISKH
tara:strand:- start:4604 stop:5803 length:1200 start_codon:yes stop_codon:yes gene_type:complete